MLLIFFSMEHFGKRDISINHKALSEEVTKGKERTKTAKIHENYG